MNSKSYGVPKDYIDGEAVKHSSKTRGDEFTSRFNKASSAHHAERHAPMDDDALQKDFDKIMGRRKRRFYRFKAVPTPAKPTKAVKEAQNYNPEKDDKDQEKLDLEFYRLSRFAQAKPAAAKKAVKAAAPAAGGKSDKYVSNLVSDLDITPEEDKMNVEFNKIMDMERFKQKSTHRHHHRQDGVFASENSAMHKSA